MLGVRLREHHELDVGRVAAKRAEARVEVVDLVGRERQAELAFARSSAARPSASSGIDRRAAAARSARTARATSRRSSNTVSVMRSWISGSSAARSPSPAARRRASPTWYTTPRSMRFDRGEPAVVRDVGRLRRPRRDRAGPRNDDQRGARRAPPPCRAGRRSAAARASSRSSATSGRVTSTKCHQVAASDVMRCEGAAPGGVRGAWRRGTAKAPPGRARKGVPSKVADVKMDYTWGYLRRPGTGSRISGSPVPHHLRRFAIRETTTPARHGMPVVDDP